MNFFQDLKQKLEKGVETAGQKSQRMLEMSRLTLKIKGKKEDIERMANKLGWEVYNAWEPKGKLEETDQIQESLKAIHDLNEQLKSLQKELDELRNANITTRAMAEKVNISPPGPEGPPAALRQADVPSNQTSHPEWIKTVTPVTPVVYICPFCAHQVARDASNCTHCQQRFY
ncbi:hypothetical protein ACFO25_08480 [Paenactinomyces guangxiensis]|uniref:Uncharacterized protein n=1 Tax=Paenactinomyces guangxiensis TaxID=1490290 RepID=A0A7W2A799_9BACL|nr:hypothetical protein [Paenactinomyces guangxiensis]MBA4492919.1 hypothetical protein [Paenactinomyces guangxiensis]MBH8590232.1 hypothetical protein [Paenactinomyces guangxiensis]